MAKKKSKSRDWSYWLKIGGGIFVALLLFFLIGTLGEKDDTIEFYKTKNIELNKQIQTCEAKPIEIPPPKPINIEKFTIPKEQKIFKIKDASNDLGTCIDKMNEILRKTQRRYDASENNRKSQVDYWKRQYQSWKSYARGLQVGC